MVRSTFACRSMIPITRPNCTPIPAPPANPSHGYNRPGVPPMQWKGFPTGTLSDWNPRKPPATFPVTISNSSSHQRAGCVSGAGEGPHWGMGDPSRRYIQPYFLLNSVRSLHKRAGCVSGALEGVPHGGMGGMKPEIYPA